MTYYPNTPASDGFDSPLGLEMPETLTPDMLWLNAFEAIGHNLGPWRSCNDIGNYYYLGPNNTKPAYHTGVDFVLALPGNYNSAAHKPVYAATDAIVTYAQRWPPPAWGNLIVLRTYINNYYVWVRYAHVEEMMVQKGDIVKRGQQICKVGNDFGVFAYHLHYDISLSGVLDGYAGDWPGVNRQYLFANYTDPLVFTRANRPRKATPVIVKKIVVPGIEAHKSFYLSSPVMRIYPTGTEIEVDDTSGTLDPETGITMVQTPADNWLPAALVGLPELTPPPPPPPPANNVKYVNTPGDVLLLRKDGISTGAILAKLPHRTKVTILTAANANGYDLVSAPVNGVDMSGYVKDSFLSATIPL